MSTHQVSATVRLLDAWKARMGLDTDYKAAKGLHISQTTVSGWRKGRSHAAPGLAARMAKDLGENIALWCAAIEVERAHNADDRRAWEQILRQLTAAAAMVILVLGLLPFQAVASTQPIDFNGENTHYAKLDVERQTRRRSFRDLWWHALRRLPAIQESVSAEVISAVHQRFSCRIRADINAASRQPAHNHASCPPGGR